MPDEPMASIALSVIADAKVGWREPTRLAMEVPISASLFHMLELFEAHCATCIIARSQTARNGSLL
jgi:hypothetical protein